MKKTTLLVFALLFSFALIGCDNNNSQATTSTQEINSTILTEAVTTLEPTTEATYTLTLDYNDGRPDEVISGIHYGDVFDLPTAQRDGYHDGVWELTGDSTTVFVNSGFTYLYEEDITLTASYVILVYTVTFLDNDGTVLDTQNVEHGGTLTYPEDPTKMGYEFSRWDQDVETVTSDLTMTAIYDIGVYFYGPDGLIDIDYVPYGDAASAPLPPNIEGHTFTGWDITFDQVTEILTVNAIYSLNTYVVTFNDINGAVLKTETVHYGESATPPSDPVRDGYLFDSWDKDYTLITEDININAVYKIGVFFFNYDGTLLGEDYVVYCQSATAPSVPKREGYTFLRWEIDFDYVTEVLTVYALFTENSYTVTFQDYDGTVLSTQSVLYDYSAMSPENPERTGYTFDGWDIPFNSITEDITVTATYSIKECTITFNVDGGTYITSITADYGSIIDLPIAEKEDNYFLYWEEEAEVSMSYTVYGDVTLTAIYQDVLADFTYSIYEGNFVLIDAYNGSDSEVIIPDRYLGLDVAQISADAFRNNTTITKVTFGSHLYVIETYAFAGCTNLEEMSFEDTNSLYIIEDYAFLNCTSLINFDLRECKVLTRIDSFAFSNCSGLEDMFIPASVNFIGSQVFNGCSNLIIYVEASVDGVDWENDWNLNNRPVYYDVVDYGNDTILNYIVLSSNEVSVLGLVDGVNDVLIYIPETILSFPVTIIYEEAFANSDIETIILPEHLTQIGARAFYYCLELTIVTFDGVDLEVIGTEAFKDTPSLCIFEMGYQGSLTTIEDSAFSNSGSFDIYIPLSVVNMGPAVFTSSYINIFIEASTQPETWRTTWDFGVYHVYWDIQYS